MNTATTTPATQTRTIIHVWTDGGQTPQVWTPTPENVEAYLLFLRWFYGRPGDRVEVRTEDSDSATGANGNAV